MLPDFMRLTFTVLTALFGFTWLTSASPRTVTPSLPSAADSVGDPVARLQARIDAGDLRLAYDSAYGYLPALLTALNIPVASQTFVFSRTSLQTDRIAPWTPRALYFNDDVYVGFVHDSPFLEIGAVHPTRGGVFYTLPQRADAGSRLSRESMQCLMCHQSRAATGGVPGFMVLSNVTDRLGYPISGAHDGSTTDATPWRARAGGWYLTGSVGSNGHAANRWHGTLSHEVSDKAVLRTRFTADSTRERVTLHAFFDTTLYLTGQSDVVALAVLTHQTVVHNRIAAVHEAARAAALTALSTGGSVDTITPELRQAASQLVRAMLFIDEAPLTAPIRGSTRFATDFAARGPRDREGQSLRTLDLERRLFRWPLSFLIYSEAFDALPPVPKRLVYARIAAVLNDQDGEFHLAEADRRGIKRILTDTKKEFPGDMTR
jgi:hypothetical protein